MQDLLECRLVKLSIEYFTAKSPGPAGRWLIERLKAVL